MLKLFRKLCRDTPGVCLSVEKLVLNGCVRLSDKGLSLVANWCPELRHLETKGCVSVTNAGVLDLVSQCVNIEHLDISGNYQPFTDITGVFMLNS